MAGAGPRYVAHGTSALAEHNALITLFHGILQCDSLLSVLHGACQGSEWIASRRRVAVASTAKKSSKLNCV